MLKGNGSFLLHRFIYLDSQAVCIMNSYFFPRLEVLKDAHLVYSDCSELCWTERVLSLFKFLVHRIYYSDTSDDRKTSFRAKHSDLMRVKSFESLNVANGRVKLEEERRRDWKMLRCYFWGTRFAFNEWTQKLIMKFWEGLTPQLNCWTPSEWDKLTYIEKKWSGEFI